MVSKFLESWWKVIEGVVAAATVSMYSFVVVLGGEGRRILIERVVLWCLDMNLPSSTIGTRCPLPIQGYRIMVSFIFLFLRCMKLK